MARMEKLLIRLDQETKRLLQQLAERQGTSLSDAARFAIREVSWRRGLSGHQGDLLTERARKALQRAAAAAAGRRHENIGPEHLLLGLLDERDGRAALTLASLQVDLDRAYATAEELLGPGSGAAGGPLGLSEEAKGIVERAVEEANRLGHHYVGTEHLLLGLLTDERGPTRHVCEALGVAPRAIRALIELQKERWAGRFIADQASGAGG